MPGENGFGTYNLYDFLQGFSSETFADFSEEDTLGVAERQSSLQWVSKDPILGGRVFVTIQESSRL